MPSGRARNRIYPRSVGVLGHGFLAEPVLERLVRALPETTQVSTYGRDPDLLTRAPAAWGKTRCKPCRPRRA